MNPKPSALQILQAMFPKLQGNLNPQDAEGNTPLYYAYINGAEKLCMGLASCLGFTFQSDAATPATPVKCYFKSAIHFTASHSTCVAPGGEGKPGCSPLPGEMSLGGCIPVWGSTPD